MLLPSSQATIRHQRGRGTMTHLRNSQMLIVLGILGCLSARAAAAQDLSILDPGHTQLISQEISGDAAYGHVRFMSQFHRPRGGSDGLWSVA